MIDFMFFALLAALGVAILSGPLGCLMMWRRVSLLGDTLSHGSILGLSIGFLLGIHPLFALCLMTLIWVTLLWFLGKNGKVSMDAALAFLTHSSLAIAIVIFALTPFGSPNLMEAFVGNILAVEPADLFLIYGMDVVIVVLLFFFWKKWVLISISPDLARAQKVPVNMLQVSFLMMIGLFIAFAIKVMGALLAPAFLIIPAMAARPFSKTPEKMAFFASLMAIAAACLGLYLSFLWDLPTGPVMVCAALSFYLISVSMTRIIKNVLIKTD